MNEWLNKRANEPMNECPYHMDPKPVNWKTKSKPPPKVSSLEVLSVSGAENTLFPRTVKASLANITHCVNHSSSSLSFKLKSHVFSRTVKASL